MRPLVSVIIPTYNSARTLELSLISLQNQTYKNIEIIIVDNFSTDTTREIAKKYTENVFEKWPERTAQKNHGIEKAKGEYLCFIDSDMELTPWVISSCIDIFEADENIGGICIPEDSIWEGLFVSIRAFERTFYAGTGIESARFFRKSDVVEVGGFEEDLIFFEESLLPQKIDAKLGKSGRYRISDMIHHHEWDISLWKWLEKKYYYGKSLSQYKKKVAELGILSIGIEQINIINRYTLFLREEGFYKKPILAVGVLGLKTLEFISGGIGFLFNKII